MFTTSGGSGARSTERCHPTGSATPRLRATGLVTHDRHLVPGGLAARSHPAAGLRHAHPHTAVVDIARGSETVT